jgi:hypothetical protein
MSGPVRKADIAISQLRSECNQVYVNVHADYGYVTCSTYAYRIGAALVRYKNSLDYIFVAYVRAMGLPEEYKSPDYEVIWDSAKGGG